MARPDTTRLRESLSQHPHVVLGHHPTPIDQLANLSKDLGLKLSVKRDDCNGLAFGGNKVRQLEYYLGPAVKSGADTVLVTGAVQSNFVRTTAAAAAKLGLAAHVQLEDRVADADQLYATSGNVLINQLVGASLAYFPEGENEAAADAALDERAAELKAQGRHPYVMHLGADSAPLGGLGYAAAAGEVIEQLSGDLPDVVVIPSGSGLTHAGFLTGARLAGWDVPVIGICVRRAHDQQEPRIKKRCAQLESLLNCSNIIQETDIVLRDDVLAPGYGQMNNRVAHAINIAARREALLLDPVYSGRTLAGIIDCLDQGIIEPGARVLMIHTGGNPAIFAYQDKLANALENISPVHQA